MLKLSKMDNLKSLWSLIKDKPFWLRAIIMALACALMVFLSISCGSITKATIRHLNEGASTKVSISTNNPTNWSVTPDVQLQK